MGIPYIVSLAEATRLSGPKWQEGMKKPRNARNLIKIADEHGMSSLNVHCSRTNRPSPVKVSSILIFIRALSRTGLLD
jgi:hypothetical protein